MLGLRRCTGDLGEYRLPGLGDTRGDRELLAAAQDAHFRHFHAKKKRAKSAALTIVVSGLAPRWGASRP